ncbi:MAG TPA: prepilin-type N-terminal cleavage/methylation domain-containing protein [Alphaproteobacteria bacterium]|nr:prepilin-type N-terminal cleavage/methylation domain-containing protein [Alphaproteobacteria bacterium]
MDGTGHASGAPTLPTDRANPLRDARGFTLVELLMVLALLALAVSAALAAIGGGQRALAARLARPLGVGEVAAVQDSLRRDIARALPVVRFARETRLGTFVGAPDGLRLHIAEPALGGTAELALALEGGTLSRSLGPAEAPGLAARPEPLLAGVHALRFAYYGLAAGEEGARWHDRWAELAPPQLVSVTARLAGGQAWPPLIVALRQQPEDR